MSWNVTLPSFSCPIRGFLAAHRFWKSSKKQKQNYCMPLPFSNCVKGNTSIELLSIRAACKPPTAREVRAVSRSQGKWALKFWGIYLFLLISKDDFDIPIVIIRSLARKLEFASRWADSHLECLRKSITQSPLYRSVCLMVKSSRSYQARRVLIHTRWNLEAKDIVLELLITLWKHTMSNCITRFDWWWQSD